MKYIYGSFEEEQIFIETDDEGYPIRQINIENNNTSVSCRTDCLAEGPILIDQLEGEFNIINKNVFFLQWEKAIKNYRKSWNNNKQIYTLNKSVLCSLKYFYPQGMILGLDNAQGICRKWSKSIPKTILYPNTSFQGIVSGYDEDNLWIEISDIRLVEN